MFLSLPLRTCQSDGPIHIFGQKWTQKSARINGRHQNWPWGTGGGKNENFGKNLKIYENLDLKCRTIFGILMGDVYFNSYGPCNNLF